MSFVRLTFYGALPPSVLSLLSPVGLLAAAPRMLSATALSLVWPSPRLLRTVLDTNAPLTLRTVSAANDTEQVGAPHISFESETVCLCKGFCGAVDDATHRTCT